MPSFSDDRPGSHAPNSRYRNSNHLDLRKLLDDPAVQWHLQISQRERDALLLGLWCAQRDPVAKDMLRSLGGYWLTKGLEVKLGGQVRWDDRIRHRLIQSIDRNIRSLWQVLGLPKKPAKYPDHYPEGSTNLD